MYLVATPQAPMESITPVLDIKIPHRRYGLCHLSSFDKMIDCLALQTELRISYIPKGFNNCYIYYQISQSLENTKFIAGELSLLFPLRYIVPPVFTNSVYGAKQGQEII